MYKEILEALDAEILMLKDEIAARDKRIETLEEGRADLVEFRDRAFEAHPNIDLDIAAL